MSKLRNFLPLLVFALVCLFATEVLACPGCKEAVANQQNPESVGLRNGYFWSIVMFLSVPMSLFGTGFFMVVRAVKRGSLPEM